ncbi:hypothetical protein [Schlesneria paludicola]|uniref:hypothetical protein n=1 Tax=Schlesneria paludicola TaxID=360056 RepID=UPI0012FAB70F|nr:hypothetical protein [Schlesneria paludicola]
MATAVRAIAAVIAGVLVALILLIAVELFSAVVHPLPPDFGETMEDMCQHVANYPQWVLAVVVPLWAATALASTWVANRISGRGAALFVGMLLIAAAGFNVWMLPYPTWFKIMIPLLIPIAVYLGSGAPSRRHETGTSDHHPKPA